MSTIPKPKTKLKIANKVALAVIAVSAIATVAAVIAISSQSKLKVVAPKKGEIIAPGASVPVLWDFKENKSNLKVMDELKDGKITLYKGSKKVKTIKSKLKLNAYSGFYIWRVPSDLSEGTNYKIKVEMKFYKGSKLSKTRSAKSNSFTVSKGAINGAVNGTCGTANGGTFPTAPTAGLCASGTASALVGTGPWTWACTGINGGTSSACTAVKTGVPQNGVCGIADGATTAVTPTVGLCAVGTATTIVPNNNGGCGASNGVATTITPATDGLCLSNWSWTCAGLNGGITDACGSFHTGSVSGVTLNNNNWTWTCSGATGTNNVNCLAPNTNSTGVCGSANNGTFATIPTANLCVSGTVSAVTQNSSNWIWTCGGTACSAFIGPPVPVGGTCGTANGTTRDTIPTAPAEICATGTASAITGTGPWYWTCGETACSALKSVVPQGPCGLSNGGTFPSAPIANLCADGITPIPPNPEWPLMLVTENLNTGNWIWNCGATVCSAVIGPSAPVAEGTEINCTATYNASAVGYARKKDGVLQYRATINKVSTIEDGCPIDSGWSVRGGGGRCGFWTAIVTKLAGGIKTEITDWDGGPKRSSCTAYWPSSNCVSAVTYAAMTYGFSNTGNILCEKYNSPCDVPIKATVYGSCVPCTMNPALLCAP